AYNNLATVLGINENYDEAVAYYKKGFAILEEIKDTVLIAGVASNTAIYIKKTNDFEEARKWALKAIELGEKYNKPDAYSYGNYIMETFEYCLYKALFYIDSALNKSMESRIKTVLADALDIYGIKLSEQGRHQAAITSVEEAIMLHREAAYN